MSSNSKGALPSSSKRVYSVVASDLPLSCPMPQTRLWDGHPRIYLPITKLGFSICPYCGTEYQLVDSDKTHTS